MKFPRQFVLACCLLVTALTWIFPRTATAEETVSMEFNQAMAIDVLKIIAMRGNQPVMIGGKGARRQITVRGTDLPVSQAFAQVAAAAGLEQRQVGPIAAFLDAESADEVPVPPPAPRTLPRSPNTSVSMDFREVDIRDLLRLVSRKTGMTVIPEKAVRGNLTCRLSDIDGEDVIRAAALAVGCECAKVENAFLVADGPWLRRFLSEHTQAGEPVQPPVSDLVTISAMTPVSSQIPISSQTPAPAQGPVQTPPQASAPEPASPPASAVVPGHPPAQVPATIPTPAVAPTTGPATGLAAATVDLVVNDLDLRLAMNLAALACGRDFLATGEVRGNVRLALRDLSEARLMRLLASTQGFAAERFGNLWALSTPERMAGFASPPLWPFPAPAAASTPGSLLNLEFRDANIRDILTLAARKGNKPLRFPPDLAGRLSMRISGVPVGEALHLVTRAGGFTPVEDRTGIEVHTPQGNAATVTIEPDLCPMCPPNPSGPPKTISDSDRVAAEIVLGEGPRTGGGAITLLAIARGPAGSFALATAGGALKTLEPGTILFDRKEVKRIGTDSVELLDRVSHIPLTVAFEP